MDLEYNSSFEGVLALLAALKDADAIEKSIKKLKDATEENRKVAKEANKTLDEITIKSDKLVEQQQKLDADLAEKAARAETLANRSTELDVAAAAIAEREKVVKATEKNQADWEKGFADRQRRLEIKEVTVKAAQDKIDEDRAAHEKDVVELKKFLSR